MTTKRGSKGIKRLVRSIPFCPAQPWSLGSHLSTLQTSAPFPRGGRRRGDLKGRGWEQVHASGNLDQGTSSFSSLYFAFYISPKAVELHGRKHNIS